MANGNQNVQIHIPLDAADQLLGLTIPQAPVKQMPTPAKAVAQPNPALLPAVGAPQASIQAPVTIPEAEQSALGRIPSALAGLDETPWSQLGTGGKIGRVAKDIAIGAGSEFVPAIMPYIPGTPQNAMLRLREASGTLGALGTQGVKEAQVPVMQAQVPSIEAGTALTKAKVPLTQAQAQLTGAQAQMYNEGLQSMNSPEIQGAFKTLADPKATPDQRRTAMATISQSPIGMLPLFRGELSGAQDLYREGEIGQRMGGKNIIPSSSSPTGYSTLLYDRFGNVIGEQPVEPSAQGQLLLGPQGGQLMGMESQLAGRRAAATQAQGLIPIISPETNEVIGYAPKGGVAAATGAGRTGVEQAMAGGITPAPTTTVVGQAQMADSLQNMISENILPALDEADKAGEMGPASGRVQQFLLKKIGDPDSPAAKLQATLDAVPMMLGRMYGYRSAEYAEHLNNFMSTRMTPDALKAYLSGVTAHARTIVRQGGMGREQPAAATNLPGTGKIFDSARWAKANPKGDVNAAKAQAKAEGYEVR